MSELLTIKIDSNFQDFYNVYEHNKKLVGNIYVHSEIYSRYIKLLSIMPLKDKKLEIFLKLDYKQKAGFMSKYVLKCAKNWMIPQVFIKEYIRSIDSYKISKKYCDEGSKYWTIDKCKSENKNMVHNNILLLDAIFEIYDMSRQRQREKKLKRILTD